MNREIKFRAWDGVKMSMNTKTIQEIADGGVVSRDPVKLLWLQFTGLYDMDANEVYEGDIMCWPEYEGKKHQTRWVVKWDSKESGWVKWSPKGKAKIIGNIYENPELITN